MTNTLLRGITCCLMVSVLLTGGKAAGTEASSSSIAFIRNGNLWVMRPDGGEQRQLSTSGKCAHPSWSPRADCVVFVSDGNIWMVKLAGGSPQRLTTSGDCCQPAWRPETNQVWYSRMGKATASTNYTRAMSMWQIDASGGPSRYLFAYGHGYHPGRTSWRPDGRLLAVDFDQGGEGGGVFFRDSSGRKASLSLEGKEQRWGTWGVGEVAWNPGNPSQVALAKLYRDDLAKLPSEFAWSIVLLDLASHIEVPIYDAPRPQAVDPTGAAVKMVSWPSWSPEGTSLVYCLSEWGDQKDPAVYSIPWNGGQSALLATPGQQPAWSPVLQPSPVSQLPGTKPVAAGPPKGVPSYLPDIRWDTGKDSMPFGIAVDRAGCVYVTDPEGHRLLKFASDGRRLAEWGPGGSGPGQFASPSGVAVDAGGNVLVADSTNQRIQKFAPDGRLLTKWTAPNPERREFFPSGIAVDAAGSVYVTSEDSFRVWKFTSSGGFLKSWGRCIRSGEWQDCGNSGYAGIAVDANGVLYVINVVTEEIERHTTDGRRLPSLTHVKAGYAFLAVGPDGNIYVPEDDAVLVLSPQGARVSRLGVPRSGLGEDPPCPGGVAFDRSGNLYVTDRWGRRIERLRPDSTPLPPPPITSTAHAARSPELEHLTIRDQVELDVDGQKRTVRLLSPDAKVTYANKSGANSTGVTLNGKFRLELVRGDGSICGQLDLGAMEIDHGDGHDRLKVLILDDYNGDGHRWEVSLRCGDKATNGCNRAIVAFDPSSGKLRRCGFQSGATVRETTWAIWPPAGLRYEKPFLRAVAYDNTFEHSTTGWFEMRFRWDAESFRFVLNGEVSLKGPPPYVPWPTMP